MSGDHGSFGAGKHCDCDTCEADRELVLEFRMPGELHWSETWLHEPTTDLAEAKRRMKLCKAQLPAVDYRIVTKRVVVPA